MNSVKYIQRKTMQSKMIEEITLQTQIGCLSDTNMVVNKSQCLEYSYHFQYVF
jgi:hypothetical protein